MGLDLVIFDWSGVLSDDRGSVYEANMRVFRQFNKPILSMEEFLRSSTMTFSEFALNHGINEPADKLLEFYKTCYNEVKKEGILPVMYFNVQAILKYIQINNKKLAVLSSHPIKSLLEEADSYKIRDLFNVIVGEVNNKVKGLQLICEHFDISPDSSLYIGDTIYDVRSSKEAGVHSAAVYTGYHSREMLEAEKPEYILKDLTEIIKIIK